MQDVDDIGVISVDKPNEDEGSFMTFDAFQIYKDRLKMKRKGKKK